MSRHTGNLYALLAASLWGTTAAVVKLIGSHLTGVQILFYSSAIAILSLAVIVTYQRKWRIVRSYGRKDYVRFAYMAFIGVFLYYVLLYTALQLVPGQEAFIVNYTWPVWVVIFAAIVLREKLTIAKSVAIVLGFVGVYIVVTRGHITSFAVGAIGGNILALVAACAYGFFSVLSKRNNDDKVTSTFFFYVFAFVYTGVYLVLSSSFAVPTTRELPGLIWLGVATSGVAFVLWQLALKHGDTGTVSNIVFITPFLSLLYLGILTGEQILPSSIIGACTVVGGLLVQSLRTRFART